MVYITRKATFSAAHRLHNPQLSDEENQRLYGLCNNPMGHGHNYTVEITVAGEPDPRDGMVIDLGVLGDLIDEVLIKKVDHKFLNYQVDFLQGVIPTAENLARRFWEVLHDKLPRGTLYEVRVHESEHNSAFYRGE
jgi:6-pyruvoyltetrahydropterin/6-carboxytetrahydropterin synthase